MPRPDRPDPDALLAQLRGEAARTARGRLRIYFGANAGVGKTWAMLVAARRERAAGRDVLIGVVETHGRKETAALLDGLARLPLRDVADRGHALAEFDLDAALARRPAVLLVDELAHSNAPGSRHAKRWQDVRELLDAGIDVWSALNVQHLEGLNGTIGAITGVRVQETVPDRVLDEADEVVLVDVTPDELTARMAAGKVYLPGQAERAARNFFRKGNLIALREIALRRTAEHVEDDMRGWRVAQSGVASEGGEGPQAWDTSGAILACVGPREDAAQTVRTAARLAARLNVRWHAAYVETPALQRLPASRRDRVLAVLELAGELGAATAVLTGEDVARTLAAEARRLNCATLVIGRAGVTSGWRRIRLRVPLARALARRAPSLDIVEAAAAPSSRRLSRQRPRAALDDDEDGDGDDARADRPPSPWRGCAWAGVSGIAVTLIATPLSGVLEEVNIVMLFLLGVVGIALRFGRAPAALAALLNVAAFDFFFVAPRFSFAISDVQYLVTFAVMLAVGLLVGQLTAGLRFTARVSASRERRAQSLFELARELSGALERAQVAALGAAAVQRHFGGAARVLVADASDRLVPPEPVPEGFDTGVADWVFAQGRSAGLSTATLAAQSWHYVPLAAPMRVRGVLALRPARARWLRIPEQARQLETLARQIAIALERVHYVEVAQRAVVEMESESLRNTLLAAISHDVRTPLTALVGLADSLQAPEPGAARSPADPARAETARAIVAQAHALHALVGNLLEMARLEGGVAGGAVALRREWQSVEEVVGSAIRLAGPALGERAVATDLAPDLPLVEFDAVLMERVLVNLLENAAKYGAPPFVIAAHVTDAALVVAVRDHGAGLPPSMRGREHALFDKFTRGRSESATPGVGLGLAICKAIVGAHGGTIAAADGARGGAEFTLVLPRRAPPAMTEPAEAAGPDPRLHHDPMNKPVAIVVEDEPQIRRFVRGALETEGWQVHEAGSLREGTAAVGTRSPDLVVLDLGLPDGDGIDLIRDVRGWSAVPIIVLSARLDEIDKIAALDAGADDYLTKPFGTGELLARVRANLRRRQGAAGGAAADAAGGAVFRFGDVEVDRVARVVRRRDAEVHLTPIEYRLLTALVASPGRVLTQRHLLREVWGPSHVDQGHYLRIYMGHLRQKLEADPAQPRHLLTETAVGYRLMP